MSYDAPKLLLEGERDGVPFRLYEGRDGTIYRAVDFELQRIRYDDPKPVRPPAGATVRQSKQPRAAYHKRRQVVQPAKTFVVVGTGVRRERAKQPRRL